MSSKSFKISNFYEYLNYQTFFYIFTIILHVKFWEIII